MEFPKKIRFFFQKLCLQLGKSGFRVLSSMKGTLWVSQNRFLSFSSIRLGHILKTWRFLSLRYSADLCCSRLDLDLRSSSVTFSHLPILTFATRSSIGIPIKWGLVELFKLEPEPPLLLPPPPPEAGDGKANMAHWIKERSRRFDLGAAEEQDTKLMSVERKQLALLLTRRQASLRLHTHTER